VLGHKRFELTDYGMSSSASYLASARTVIATSLSSASAAAEGVHEWEVFANPRALGRATRPAPDSWPLACFEPAGGSGLNSRSLFDGEAAEVRKPRRAR